MLGMFFVNDYRNIPVGVTFLLRKSNSYGPWPDFWRDEHTAVLTNLGKTSIEDSTLRRAGMGEIPKRWFLGLQASRFVIVTPTWNDRTIDSLHVRPLNDTNHLFVRVWKIEVVPHHAVACAPYEFA